MHGELGFGHCGKPQIQGVRNGVRHSDLIGILIHFQVFIRICHIAQFDQGRRNFGPVIAGHAVGLPHVLLFGPCLLTVGIQKNLGETGGGGVEFRMIGVVLGDADGHRTVGTGVFGAVGVDTDKSICFVFVGNRCAFGTADRIESIEVSELYFISPIFQFGPYLLADIHCQLIFVKTACLSECTFGIRLLHFRRTGSDGFHGPGNL